MKPTYEQLEQQLAESQIKLEKMAAEIHVINADNAYLRDLVLGWARECDRITYTHTNKVTDAHQSEAERVLANTSPATDDFLAEVRASGVDAAIEHLLKKFEGTGSIGVPVMALESLAHQLRQGGAV